MSWAVWITGAPGSGTSAIAAGVAAAVATRGHPVRLLALDEVRAQLAPSSPRSSGGDELVHRGLVYLGWLLTDTGVPVIVDAGASPRAWRDLARTALSSMVEAELGAPGDANGAYERAESPDLTVDTAWVTPTEAVQEIVTVALGLAARTPRGCEPRRWAPRRPGWTMWLTGLPGSGKTTLAHRLVETLGRRALPARVLDVTEIRQFVVGGRRTSPAQEDVVHRLLVVAAALLTESGTRVVIDAVAARRGWRELGRTRIARFTEVQLLCPLGLCCDRERAVRWNLTPCAGGGRPKAAPGEGPDVVLDYEPSLAPDLTIRTDVVDVDSALATLGWLAARLEHEPEPASLRTPGRTRCVYVI